MKVDLYERIWMWGVGVVLAMFFTTTAIAALGHHFQPPSHVETIDPAGGDEGPAISPRRASASMARVGSTPTSSP